MTALETTMRRARSLTTVVVGAVLMLATVACSTEPVAARTRPPDGFADATRALDLQVPDVGTAPDAAQPDTALVADAGLAPGLCPASTSLTDIRNLTQLKARFNADKSIPRLLLLVSPG